MYIYVARVGVEKEIAEQKRFAGEIQIKVMSLTRERREKNIGELRVINRISE